MSRTKMAYVAKIKEILPIEGKDKIGIMTFEDNGWQVIVQKEEFKNELFAVYCETDSILPEKPEFEFLRKRCYSEKYEGFVIRPMKMAGIISNGIAFNLNVLHKIRYEEGEDVTKLLNIRNKSEIDENLALIRQGSKTKKRLGRIRNFIEHLPFVVYVKGVWKKKFGLDFEWPTGIQKTDEERIENMPPQFYEGIKGARVYVTEKADGTSITCSLIDGKFKVCSRNNCVLTLLIKEANEIFRNTNPVDQIVKRLSKWINNSQMPNAVWQMVIANLAKYEIPFYLTDLKARVGSDVYVQGELVGPGIQKNPMNLPAGGDYLIFNVGLVGGVQIAITPYNLSENGILLRGGSIVSPKFVKNISEHNIDETCLADFKAKAKGKYDNTDSYREGVVYRFLKLGKIFNSDVDLVDTVTYSGLHVPRGSFKVINDDYLL